MLPYIVYTDFGKLYLVFSVQSYRSIENTKISFAVSQCECHIGFSKNPFVSDVAFGIAQCERYLDRY